MCDTRESIGQHVLMTVQSMIQAKGYKLAHLLPPTGKFMFSHWPCTVCIVLDTDMQFKLIQLLEQHYMAIV